MQYHLRTLPPFPATDFTLTQFVAHQCQTCKSDTLRGYLSHIRDFQQNVLGMPFAAISTRFTLQAALSGIKRHFGEGKKPKQAITIEMLKRIHAAILDGSFERKTGHSPGAIRCVWAAILIGFFGMLRKANVASKWANTFDPKCGLTRGDLARMPDSDDLWLRCRFSKTNQAGARTHFVPLPHTGGPLCPDTAYSNHVADYPDVTTEALPQPAFMYNVKGKRVALSHAFLVKTMKQMLECIGERQQDYAGHSLRRGGASLAFALGATIQQVMALGDWVSLAVLGYNETEVDFLQDLPRRMAGAAT